MDFIVQLPKTQAGFDAILVVVDRFSQMCHFIPTHTSVDAHGTSELFQRYTFSVNGMPESILCTLY